MAPKVIKILVAADDDTAAMIDELADEPVKGRERRVDKIVYFDKNELPHELHFITAEVI